IDYYLSAVLPPDESIEIKLQVYDFSISRWLTVSINNLSFYEKNIGSNIGYIKDYLNSELNMFTRLEINAGRRGSVDIKVNYLDLMFYYYERGIYTIKPYKALVENYIEITRESYVEAFKLASLDNGDIISKTGYQPMQYLRLTDGYDNSVPRNLLHHTTQGFYYDSYGFTYNGYKTTVDGREAIAWSDTSNIISLWYNGTNLVTGKKYTLSFYAKASKELNLQQVYINTANTRFLLNQTVNTKWNRYSFTFIAKDDGKGNRVTFHSYPEVNNGEKIFYLSDMKLEFGDKATKVQPNPEDIYGANDPNKYIDILPKDKDNNVINNKVLPINYREDNINLLKTSDLIMNTHPMSYVQGDTKSLDMSLWGTRITQEGSMEKVLEPYTTYTLSYDLEMLEQPTVPVFRQSPGIIVYSRNPANVIAETRFVNGGSKRRLIPEGTKERVELTFTMPQADNVELIAYTGLFNESGDSSPYETREYSKVRFTNIKLEKGSKATPYKPNPEENVQFLDKAITLGNINTKVQSIV